MSSIGYGGTFCVASEANHIPDASLVSAAHVRKIVRLFAIAVAAGTLAACAQSSVVTRNSQQASLGHDRAPSFASAKRHTPYARQKNATETASHGLASFYTEGTQTASGEKFDTRELTAVRHEVARDQRLDRPGRDSPGQ
jgi:rare lipoprotein A